MSEYLQLTAPSRDWKSIHLNWISKQLKTGWLPRNAEDLSESYLEIMKFTYSKDFVSQAYAERCYLDDIKWTVECEKAKTQLLKSLIDSSKRYFVTIGFNHQTWTIQRCITLIKRIMEFDWVEKYYAVFELHRENGLHPHVHMMIQTSLTKSKLSEKLWAVRGIKDIVLKKPFIDVKPYESYRDKYLLGEKTESKMPYVIKDQQWRTENQIPHYFEK